MKKLLLFLSFLLLSNTGFSQIGWYWQNPKPTFNNINAVVFKGSDTVISVGDGGMILRSNNRGNTWYPQTSGFNVLYSIYDVKFINQNKGILSGNGGIMATSNGGANWFNTNISPGYCYKIFILDSLTVYAASNDNIFKSTNGGLYWTTLLSYQYLRSVSFINSNTGFAVGYITSGGPPQTYYTSLLLRTTNGGSSWTQSYMGDGFQFNDVVFANNGTGFILCTDNHLFKTTDSGLNWNSQIIALSGMNRMICLDANRYFAVGSDGMMKTTDGGASWGFAGLGGKLKDISFNNSGTGIIVGNTGSMFMSTNNGVTWQNLQTGLFGIDGHQFNAVHFTDFNHGSVVGVKNGSGVIYQTSNGGSNWSLQYGITKLNDVFFLNIETGYTVGNNGFVSKTTNTGIDWTNTFIPLASDLMGIYFINLNTGIIVGGSGTIGKTVNGGQTWNVQHYVNYPAFNKVNFYNDSVGAIVGAGQGGTILWTTDCGSTWVLKNSGFSFYTSLNGISLLNETTAIIADRDGRILKTTNAGLNWRDVYSYFNHCTFNNVVFKDSQNGIIIGNNGIIMSTSNSGENWFFQQSNTFNNLYGCSLRGPNDITITGNFLSILSTSDASTIGIKNISGSIPYAPSLFQNYPNPFNPATKIKFDISKSSLAKIIIYDILGREIATLLNEELKPGTYSVDWDGSNYASGIYFYKLVANDFVETKKMVLMK